MGYTHIRTNLMNVQSYKTYLAHHSLITSLSISIFFCIVSLQPSLKWEQSLQISEWNICCTLHIYITWTAPAHLFECFTLLVCSNILKNCFTNICSEIIKDVTELIKSQNFHGISKIRNSKFSMEKWEYEFDWSSHFSSTRSV